jgi:hypothetical protein
MSVRSAVAALVLLASLACGDEEAPPPEPPPAVPAEPVEPEPVAPLEPEPEPVSPSTHELLFLVLHDAPLLPSEERLLGVEEARLDRRNDVERRDATQEEAAFAEIFLAGGDRTTAALPETFGEARRVLFMRVTPPRTRSDGELVARGFDGVLLFRLPDLSPVFELRLDDEAPWRLADDQWSGWLTGLLRESEGT